MVENYQRAGDTLSENWKSTKFKLVVSFELFIIARRLHTSWLVRRVRVQLELLLANKTAYVSLCFLARVEKRNGAYSYFSKGQTEGFIFSVRDRLSRSCQVVEPFANSILQ